MTQFLSVTGRVTNRLKTRFQILEPEELGYSGYESGNSGFTRILRIFFRILRTWNFISHILVFLLFPKCYKTLFTLSRALSHSLSCVLSLSLVLSFPQTLETQNPPSTLDPRLTGASLGWWIIYSACSIPGRLGFKPLEQGRAHPKVNKLGLSLIHI